MWFLRGGAVLGFTDKMQRVLQIHPARNGPRKPEVPAQKGPHNNGHVGNPAQLQERDELHRDNPVTSLR